MKTLKLAHGLVLPLDTVTATIVAYGGKGMGKTNLGSVLVEELARCGLRWAWLDPLGVSWGLRHSSDGSGPGVECLILGGPKGDVPIDPDGGGAVADVVIEEPHNVLIDFSRKPSGEMWSIGEKVRFVTAYALRVFQRQGELQGGRRREPLFQVLDEAARYIPQVIPSGAPDIARCVGAWEQLVEEGRNIGLGVGLMTQRSARMNKSVSELADVMFAFRTVGPNSLGAVMDWLGEHVEKARIKELAERVRSLERGQALVVSPGWLRFEGVVQIRMRETFDSSATVKAGERARTARGDGARPDLVAIRARMAAQIEKAKAEDPRELRNEISRLRHELRRAEKERPAPAKPPKPREVPVLKDAQVKRLEAAADRIRAGAATLLKAHAQQVDRLSQRMQVVVSEAGLLRDQIKAATAAQRGGLHAHAQHLPIERPGEGEPGPGTDPGPGSSARPAPRSGNGKAQLTGPEQRILDALAWLEGVGQVEAEEAAVAFIAGYTVGGGAFNNPRGALRGKGLIDYRQGGRIVLTEAGRERAAAPPEVLTADELQARVLARLPGPEQKILRALLEVYPEPLANDECARRAGYTPDGGAYNNPRGRLRTLGLIEYPRAGQVVARPVLFLEQRG